ncbi:MAG TPA: acyltransferase [Rhizomicrobium sp.]|jgi:hypothetical protein|nr:acyltransferase [Rhizomicrobium sp.]
MSGAAHVSARFRALDGWRGVCAMLVALHHLELHCWLFRQPVLREAWLFVDFFFVLSGFVLAHTYAGRLKDGAAIRIFVIRRFGRLWPLHIAVLLALVGLEVLRLVTAHGIDARPAFTYPNSPFTLLTNVFLVQAMGLHPTLTWNNPSWSISTEFYTYLVFAVICFLAPSRTMRTIIAALTAIAGAVVLARFSPLGMQETVAWGEWRCLYGFFTGVLTYEIWRSRRLAPLKGTSAEIAAVALVLILLTWFGRSRPIAFLAPPLFALAVLVFAAEAGGLSRLLTTRAGAALGRWSYGIYMIHTLVLAVLFSVLGTWARSALMTLPGGGLVINAGSEIGNDLAMLGYLAVVVGAAAAAWRLVELPGQALFSRLAVAEKNLEISRQSV